MFAIPHGDRLMLRLRGRWYTGDMARLVNRRITVLVALEVVSAVLAWRDLSRRSDASLRGPRRLWRALILANPGNSLLYWVAGRR